MVAPGPLAADPFALRTVFSVVAGASTGVVVVLLTFFLHGQQDLHGSIRAIRSELEHDIDQLAKLARLLRDDMRRQQVDLPVEVPAGTTIEVRYVLALPGALNTSAFDRMRQSGRLTDLPPDLRRDLFDLYDVVDRINRLRQHRERLHYDNAEHVHIVIDTAELDVEPGTTVTEDDLPPETRRRLDDLRRLRRAMEGINTSILRLVAAISSPDRVEELGLEEFVEADRGRGALVAAGPAESDVPTVEEMIATLDDVERRSVWARFV